MEDNINSLLTIDLATLNYEQIKLIVANLTRAIALSSCIEHLKKIFNANDIEWKFNVAQNVVWMQSKGGSASISNPEQYKSFLIKHGISASKISTGLDSKTKFPTLIIKSPSFLELQHLPTFSTTSSILKEEKKPSLNSNVGVSSTGRETDVIPLTLQFSSLHTPSNIERSNSSTFENKEKVPKSLNGKTNMS